MAEPSLQDVPHVIQTALTPVFLLSGIGILLGIFNVRGARVSDHIEHVNELMKAASGDQDALLLHMRRLRIRLLALDVATASGAFAGASTCIAALTLFIVTAREISVDRALLVLFGLALGCTVVALFAFLADTVLAWHGLRREGPVPRPKQVVQ